MGSLDLTLFSCDWVELRLGNREPLVFPRGTVSNCSREVRPDGAST